MKLSRLTLYLLIGFFAAQIAWYYPNLPGKIATHFNAFGEADGWMLKQNFLILESTVLLFILAEFTLLPHLIEKMPDSLINLPNKKYWLAEDRRGATFAVIRTYFEWFSVALFTLFIGINQLVFRANLNRENLSPESWLMIGAFLIFVILWSIKFVRQFKINN